MKLVKKRKILQVFSNGSLSFCFNSFFSPKNSQFFFYEKDFKNSYLYVKKNDQRLIVNEDENLLYRKKYVGIVCPATLTHLYKQSFVKHTITLIKNATKVNGYNFISEPYSSNKLLYFYNFSECPVFLFDSYNLLDEFKVNWEIVENYKITNIHSTTRMILITKKR